MTISSLKVLEKAKFVPPTVKNFHRSFHSYHKCNTRKLKLRRFSKSMENNFPSFLKCMERCYKVMQIRPRRRFLTPPEFLKKGLLKNMSTTYGKTRKKNELDAHVKFKKQGQIMRSRKVQGAIANTEQLIFSM